MAICGQLASAKEKEYFYYLATVMKMVLRHECLVVFILLHLFSCQNENKRLEIGPILFKSLPFVLIFRNIHALFLKHFCESSLIYRNPNITFAFEKSIFSGVTRKSWRPLDPVVLNKSTFTFFGSYACDDQHLDSSHINLKKKCCKRKNCTQRCNLKTLLTIDTFLYTMKHDITVQFLKT